ncbi:hypothetical protein MGG_07608 [Pyricularia oryzae 70-15]|uniref:Uncharacterized protein n=1 Tax=Pyricularia oryzae (strain 70-15 / ATCC MYA-4617 / FGSC 8958) TaxID=242507 RepID=G4N2L3_PYRO7|nr:uncharacterized protein MGG_07608 [Pyricularia oryzae 70-15]EHA51722.1 hypothetical protein MGG_07608 [Pyricularia oryzae 70-15]
MNKSCDIKRLKYFSFASYDASRSHRPLIHNASHNCFPLASDAPLSGLGSAKNGAKEAVFNAGAVITNKASEIKTGLGAGTQMIGTALGSSSATQPAEGLFKRDQENAQNASRFNPRKQLGSYSV